MLGTDNIIRYLNVYIVRYLILYMVKHLKEMNAMMRKNVRGLGEPMMCLLRTEYSFFLPLQKTYGVDKIE